MARSAVRQGAQRRGGAMERAPERENNPGETRKAIESRIPWRLAALIRACMIEGRQRMESRAHGKRMRTD